MAELHNCDANAKCTNSAGSFSCACKTGFSGNGTACTGEIYYFIDSLFRPSSSFTQIIFSFCISYKFLCVSFLYLLDINECTSGTQNCDANAACTNTVGSFSCACNVGYVGSGTKCVGKICLYT